MSNISSESESECTNAWCEYCYGRAIPNITLPEIPNMPNYRPAVCYAMEQPFIYYAQVQPSADRAQRNHDTSKKSNYFAKAFRWFTQERLINANKKDSVPHSGNDMNTFAEWLDHKYEEFLRNSALDGDLVSLKLTETTVTSGTPSANATANNRRSRISSNKKDAGDTEANHVNTSFEYILYPKQLGKPVSGVSKKCDNDVCYHKSNSSLISAVMEQIRETKKSQSAADIKTPQFVIVEPKTKLNTEAQLNTDVKPTKIDDKKNNVDVPVKQSEVQINIVQMKGSFQCQCPEEMFKKSEIVQTNAVVIQDTGCDVSRTCCKCERNSDLAKQKESKSLNSVPHAVTRTENIMQTSDCSLIFDKKTVQQYPLIMKIVCASK